MSEQIGPRIELGGGWDGAESLPCWSIGPRSALKLYMPSDALQLDASLELVFRIERSVYVPPSGRRRDVAYFINNVPVRSEVVFCDDASIVELTVPANALSLEYVLIHMMPSPAPAPAEAGQSQDARKLGVHVTGVSVATRPRDLSQKQTFIEEGRAVASHFWPVEMRTNAWCNVDALTDFICTQIEHRTPSSIIRLGDGEGRILVHSDYLEPSELLREVVNYQLGPDCLDITAQTYGLSEPGEAFDKVTNDLRALLRSAVRTADAVGLPTPSHFAGDASTPDMLNGQVGFASAVIHGFALARHLPQDRFFDTFAFHGVSATGGFERILRDRPYVGIVSHTDIGFALKDVFNVAETGFFQVPPHYSFPVVGRRTSHYPEAFANLVDTIQPPFPGALFLVGAGYLGKAYCNIIKARGGIALDVGSVMDAWSGLGRPDVDADLRLAPFVKCVA